MKNLKIKINPEYDLTNSKNFVYHKRSNAANEQEFTKMGSKTISNLSKVNRVRCQLLPLDCNLLYYRRTQININNNF